MTSAASQLPLTVSRPLIAALRADLIAADYRVEAIGRLIGPTADAALHREQSLPALRAARAEPSPLATLLTCFMLGVPVPTRDLDAALPALGSAGASELGLVASIDGESLPLVDLRPYAARDALGDVDWWIASDLSELATGQPLRPDHVLGAGGASLTLAGITVRTRVRRTLDVGTGCGIQALHASRHSDHVVATDISARALNFAAFNLALCEVGNVSLRLGSLLEPVMDESFDLVISNPPFVITPRSGDAIPDYEYRDAGRSGDGLVEELVQALDRVLAPGGTAQMLANWEHHEGQPWRERIEGWLAGSPLNALVVQREVLDPAQYAETWLRDGGLTADRDPGRWQAGYADYLDDFARREVRAIGMGFVALSRPITGAPAPWRELIELPGPVTQPLGPAIAARLVARDWFAATSDAEVLATAFVVASDVTEERYYRPGSPDPSVIMIRQGGGFGHHVQMSSEVAGVVGACDGELALGQLVSAVAAITQQDAGALLAQVLPELNALVADGLLVTAAP
ncbi:methyltransferase [Rarobacter faecitabidus]|uniref:Methyltransferase family protein n=1 Tax=Rarobacter faecitabidus TaxID=13243 RepID=A0A542ZTH2_RARFA|nr:methyltransferase [Rarobacter faecitabidus]TQL63641.1 methyltransferase family protein [Rarobacter faecitabidus]